MNSDRETLVRQRAYELWEKAGRPHGRHDEHWHQAAAEIKTNGGPGSAPAKRPRKAMAAVAASSPVRRKK